MPIVSSFRSLYQAGEQVAATQPARKRELDDASKKLGYRLVGDADFESCKEVAGAITPVPGGVGPMTIAILLKNTMEGAMRANGLM